MQRRPFPAPMAALLLPAALTAGACRASDEPPSGARDPLEATPAAEAAADAARIEGREGVARSDRDDDGPPPHRPGGDRADRDVASIEASRLARLDARLLDLQAAINQLDVAGADRAECESRWEELDGRRAALRREEQGLDAELTPSDRDERRRTLAEDLDDLESDLEAAIQEVESRLSRG